MCYIFPGINRLKKSWEFENVNKMGCKYHTPHFVLLLADNSFTYPRLGITVSKKVGNAVVRNRLKRLLRETFRMKLSQLSSYDYVVIAKRNAAQVNLSQIKKELNVLNALKVISKQ
jgi:ribonuclease P protein component